MTEYSQKFKFEAVSNCLSNDNADGMSRSLQ